MSEITNEIEETNLLFEGIEELQFAIFGKTCYTNINKLREYVLWVVYHSGFSNWNLASYLRC